MRNIFVILFLVGFCGYGQQLIYTPKNPNFGGETFNYQMLLSSANAQNSFTNDSESEELTELEEFQETLNSTLLGQLTRSVYNSQLGDGLEPGTFNVGDLLLEVYESTQGLVVNILDTTTGEQTQIIVPN